MRAPEGQVSFGDRERGPALTRLILARLVKFVRSATKKKSGFREISAVKQNESMK